MSDNDRILYAMNLFRVVGEDAPVVDFRHLNIVESSSNGQTQAIVNSSCVICHEPWTDSGNHHSVSLRCGHVFGKNCIETWMTRGNCRCPQCNQVSYPTEIRKVFLNLEKNEQEEAKSKIKTLEEMNKNLEENLQTERSKCSFLESKTEELKLLVDGADQRLARETTKCNEATLKANSLEERIRQLEAEIGVVKARSEEAEKMKIEAETKCNEAISRATLLEEKNKELEQIQQNSKSETISCTRCEFVQKKNDSLELLLADSFKKMEGLHSMDSKYSSLETENAELKVKLANVEQKLKSDSAKFDKCLSETKLWEDRIRNLTQELLAHLQAKPNLSANKEVKQKTTNAAKANQPEKVTNAKASPLKERTSSMASLTSIGKSSKPHSSNAKTGAKGRFEEFLKCTFCGKEHQTRNCRGNIDDQDKLKLAKSNNLCLICLNPGHSTDKCFSNYRCPKCKGKHAILLCKAFISPASTSKT